MEKGLFTEVEVEFENDAADLPLSTELRAAFLADQRQVMAQIADKINADTGTGTNFTVLLPENRTKYKQSFEIVVNPTVPPITSRLLADVNGDKRADYCRFVGDAPSIFLSCNLATASGFDSTQYTFNSIHGIDPGYPHLPRQLADVNGDGRADYCRFVGDAPNIFLSCNLATASGFDSNQYTFNSIKGIDPGYVQ